MNNIFIKLPFFKRQLKQHCRCLQVFFSNTVKQGSVLFNRKGQPGQGVKEQVPLTGSREDPQRRNHWGRKGRAWCVEKAVYAHCWGCRRLPEQALKDLELNSNYKRKSGELPWAGKRWSDFFKILSMAWGEGTQKTVRSCWDSGAGSSELGEMTVWRQRKSRWTKTCLTDGGPGLRLLRQSRRRRQRL